jgi:hypothetical protein
MIKRIKRFFSNVIWVSQNAEFDADFDSVGKVAKKLMQKKLSLTEKLSF